MANLVTILRNLADRIESNNDPALTESIEYVLVGAILTDGVTDFACYDAGPLAERCDSVSELAKDGFRRHVRKMRPE